MAIDCLRGELWLWKLYVYSFHMRKQQTFAIYVQKNAEIETVVAYQDMYVYTHLIHGTKCVNVVKYIAVTGFVVCFIRKYGESVLK